MRSSSMPFVNKMFFMLIICTNMRCTVEMTEQLSTGKELSIKTFLYIYKQPK